MSTHSWFAIWAGHGLTPSTWRRCASRLQPLLDQQANVSGSPGRPTQAVRHIDRQRYSTLSLGLLNSPNLAAGITGVKLVEPVLNARKIVVYAVRVNGVVVVVNGILLANALCAGLRHDGPQRRGGSAGAGVFSGGHRQGQRDQYLHHSGQRQLRRPHPGHEPDAQLLCLRALLCPFSSSRRRAG